MARARKADAPLTEYRAKRDFGATPEPAGDVGAPNAEPTRTLLLRYHIAVCLVLGLNSR